MKLYRTIELKQKSRRFQLCFVSVLVGCLNVACSSSFKPTPFADIHLHFNWDQKEVISAVKVIEKLETQNVTLAVVSSTPSSLALELQMASNGNWLIPYFSPYIHPMGKKDWYLDKKVLAKARSGLKNNLYAGIGEVHMWSNKRPRFNNEVFQALLDLAEEFKAPIYIHTESSNEQLFLSICQPRSKVRFLWAHAGGILKPHHIEKVMQVCPNVWVELSARDPWRYDSLLGEKQNLPRDWISLMQRYPNRFMVGTDPVWNVTKVTHWDEADDGWDHYAMLLNFHRNWLKQLPFDLEKKIRLTNAQKFFNR